MWSGEGVSVLIRAHFQLRTLQFQLRLLRNEPRERDLNAALNLAMAVSKSSAPLTRTTVTACGLDNADVAEWEARIEQIIIDFYRLS